MSDWFEGWVLELARENGWLHASLSVEGWHVFVHVAGPVLFRFLDVDRKGAAPLPGSVLKWLGALQAAGVNAGLWSESDRVHIQDVLGRKR